MRKAIFISALLVGLLASCGWQGSVANVRQGDTIRRLETMEDPPGFERIGIELLNDGEFAFDYDGGYVVTWAANGESPEMILDAFLPVLNDAGYVTETIEQTSCTADELRLFLIWDTNFSSSSSLTYDSGDQVVAFQSNWDPRNRIDQILGEVPSCS